MYIVYIMLRDGMFVCSLIVSKLYKLREFQATHQINLGVPPGSTYFSHTIYTTYHGLPMPSFYYYLVNRYRHRFFDQVGHHTIYRKVANSSLSRLVARFQIFRRLMKGKFDAYVLWPLAKKFQNWIVDQSTARDFTV